MERLPPTPLTVGDRMIVQDENRGFPCVVRAISSWEFILVEASNGDLYLDVVMNLSAVSWSRVVQLEPHAAVADTNYLKTLAEQISFHPQRTNVADVDGAIRLCKPETRLVRDTIET